MDQLTVIIRELTKELNDIVREIEISKINKNKDDEMTLLFRASVILEKIKISIKENQ